LFERESDTETYVGHASERPKKLEGQRMANYQFSRRTVIAAVTVLERMTQAELSRFLLELGPDLVSRTGGESISVMRRLNNVISIVDQQPDSQIDDGILLRDALVEKQFHSFNRVTEIHHGCFERCAPTQRR